MWAGRINLQVGRQLVGVQYGDEKIAAALRERCTPWASSDERDVPAGFGVRTVKVGLLRRSETLLHHGVPVRARLGSVDEALDALTSFLREIEQLQALQESRPGDVAVDARAFIRDGRLVLAHVPAWHDVDARALRRLRIEEIQTWRPLVDCAAGTVTIGSRSWPLHGVVVIGHRDLSLDDARRHAWALGSPSEVAWAERIDALGGRVRGSRLDVYTAVDQLLR